MGLHFLKLFGILYKYSVIRTFVVSFPRRRESMELVRSWRYGYASQAKGSRLRGDDNLNCLVLTLASSKISKQILIQYHRIAVAAAGFIECLSGATNQFSAVGKIAHIADADRDRYRHLALT